MSRADEQIKPQSPTGKDLKSTKPSGEGVRTAADILVSALKFYDDKGGLFDIIPLPEKNGVGIFLENWTYLPENGDLLFLGDTPPAD